MSRSSEQLPPTRPSLSMRPSEQRLTETGSRPSFRGTSVLFHPVAIPDETQFAVLETPNHHVYDQFKPESSGNNSGKRLRMWPGITLLVLVTIVTSVCITYFAVLTHENTKFRSQDILPYISRIGQEDEEGKDGLVFDDPDLDVQGNPSVYPDKKCRHLNYLSKNNQIVAQDPKTGQETAIPIKGVNWYVGELY